MVPTGLGIDRLTLRNYRCFQEMTIDFHSRMTVLVAPNGGGKTALLDAIAVAFGPYAGAFDESRGMHFSPRDIRLNRVRDTASNEMEFAAGGVSLEAVGRAPQTAIWRRSLASPRKARTTVGEARVLVNYGKSMQRAVQSRGDNGAVLPVLAYYGTGRLWRPRRVILRRLTRTSRTVGYAQCLEPGSTFDAFADWFAYWNQNASIGSPAASEYHGYVDSVSRAVNCCLERTGWGHIEYDFGQQEMVAHHSSQGKLPISMLSDGIRNMIGMVADIAFRCTKLNPHLGGSAARETPGLVLIDEVDMHLHPEWQQVVLESLLSAFPNVQFVVSTHSPQVLTTVKRDCIRSLAWHDGTPEVRIPAHETYAQESRLALEDVLGVDSRPPTATNKKLLHYLRRVESGEDSSAELSALRLDLERELGLGDSQLQLADMLLARNQARRIKG